MLSNMILSNKLFSPTTVTDISFSDSLVKNPQSLIHQYERESELRKSNSQNSHTITIKYDETNYVKRVCKFDKKSQTWKKDFYPHQGNKKGLGNRYLWNCYHEDELKKAQGKWITWHEGEKATDYMRSLGIISTCIVGSGFKCPIIIRNALTAISEYDIAGVIYFADNDEQGIAKANYIKEEASKMGIPFIILPIQYLFSCSSETEAEQGDDVVEYLASLPESERNARHIRAYMLEAINNLPDEYINPLEKETTQTTKPNQSNNTLEPVKNGLKIAMKNIFGDTRWIYNAGNFYRYNGRYYDHIANDEVDYIISEWCDNYTAYNKKGQLYYPYCSPEQVRKVFKWAKTRFWVHPSKMNPNGLPMRNGILTKVVMPNDEIQFLLEPHSPNKYYTFCSEVEYNPNINSSTAEQFLECLDEPYRTLLVESLSTILGGDLIRSRYDRIKGLILVGEGANGKDTFRNIISHLLGKEGITNCNLNDFKLADNGRAFNLNRLASNPRINWSSENKSIYIDDIQSLKQAITGDPIFVEGKGKDGTDIELNTLFIFNTNKQPSLSGEQTAIQSRFEIIPFKKIYSLNPRAGELMANPRYKHDKNFLVEEVCPAMLNLLIEAYKRVYKQGIDYQKTHAYTREIMEKNNHLQAFVNDMGLVFTGNPEDRISCKELFEVLESWYIGEDILTLEENRYNPDKMDKHYHGEDDFRYDKLIKAPRQVIPRFSQMFPKAKIVKDKVTRRTCLSGIKFISPTDKIPEEIKESPPPNNQPSIDSKVENNGNNPNNAQNGNESQNSTVNWQEKIGVQVQLIHDNEIGIVEKVDNFGTIHVRFINSTEYDDKELYPIHPDEVREL